MFLSCGNAEKYLNANSKTVYKLEQADAEQYTYELIGQSCSTGEHSFSTFAAVCSALTDDSLNNECARDERELLFSNSECGGQFL